MVMKNRIMTEMCEEGFCDAGDILMFCVLTFVKELSALGEFTEVYTGDLLRFLCSISIVTKAALFVLLHSPNALHYLPP